MHSNAAHSVVKRSNGRIAKRICTTVGQSLPFLFSLEFGMVSEKNGKKGVEK
jgi:hypothetical protein